MLSGGNCVAFATPGCGDVDTRAALAGNNPSSRRSGDWLLMVMKSDKRLVSAVGDRSLKRSNAPIRRTNSKFGASLSEAERSLGRTMVRPASEDWISPRTRMSGVLSAVISASVSCQ